MFEVMASSKEPDPLTSVSRRRTTISSFFDSLLVAYTAQSAGTICGQTLRLFQKVIRVPFPDALWTMGFPLFPLAAVSQF